MAEEHERKFLVRSNAWRHSAHPDDHYRQGYLSIDPERSVLVRAGKKKAVITIQGRSKNEKSNGHGLSRSEFEYPIPLEEANRLLDSICIQPLIEKTRYKIPQNGLTWTVDQFDKQNNDLLLAEVETKSAPAHLPRWVGQDVSKDSRYENANLVQHPFSEWRGNSREPETSYHLKHGESVAEGFERIVLEQIDLAVWQLTENIDALGTAVHEARKSVKRTRAVLRLLRSPFGKTYRKENNALRQVSQQLSGVRDSVGLVEIFDELNKTYRDDFGNSSLASVRERLLARNRQFSQQFKNRGEAARLASTLRQVRGRVKKWPWKKAGFAEVLNGYSTTIRRARHAYRTACSDDRPETFHEWRKRAKDLRYHLSLVRNAWKSVFEGYLESAKAMEGNLGDDHNLVILRDTILQRPDDFGSQQDVRALVNVIDRHQSKLRDEAKTYGALFDAQKPSQWRRGLKSSWEAWRNR